MLPGAGCLYFTDNGYCSQPHLGRPSLPCHPLLLVVALKKLTLKFSVRAINRKSYAEHPVTNTNDHQLTIEFAPIVVTHSLTPTLTTTNSILPRN